jgi:hypothetical protein
LEQTLLHNNPFLFWRLHNLAIQAATNHLYLDGIHSIHLPYIRQSKSILSKHKSVIKNL